jgi:hypothetical protein
MRGADNTGRMRGGLLKYSILKGGEGDTAGSLIVDDRPGGHLLWVTKRESEAMGGPVSVCSSYRPPIVLDSSLLGDPINPGPPPSLSLNMASLPYKHDTRLASARGGTPPLFNPS